MSYRCLSSSALLLSLAAAGRSIAFKATHQFIVVTPTAFLDSRHDDGKLDPEKARRDELGPAWIPDSKKRIKIGSRV